MPKDLLECNNGEMLNRWLSLFVKETRWQVISLKDHRYAVIWSQVLSTGEKPGFHWRSKQERFAGLRGARDTVARQLKEAGVGASVKHTEGFIKEEESMLWCKSILGITSPKALLHAVFFTNGKYLCLRGGWEHELKLSQFKFNLSLSLRVMNGSKNR